VDIQWDTSQFLAGLNRIAGNLPEFADEAERETSATVVNAAKAACPVDTGALRDSIHSTRTIDGDMAVVADTPYAAAVHENYGVTHATGGAGFIRQPLLDALDDLQETARQRFGQL
jgi:hypothetical protein